MNGVLTPLLHNNVPDAIVESVEFPQLFSTVTTGADGIIFGADVPLPASLVHPFTVVVTVYIAASVTVMDGVNAPLLHNNVPAAVVDKLDVPQLFATITTGASGIAPGAEVPLPAALVQPLALVTVTV